MDFSYGEHEQGYDLSVDLAPKPTDLDSDVTDSQTRLAGEGVAHESSFDLLSDAVTGETESHDTESVAASQPVSLNDGLTQSAGDSADMLAVAVDTSTLDSGSLQMMCGCPDCVAARSGDDSGFKADGLDLPALDIDPAAAGTDVSAAAASSAPSYAIDALINPYDYQWGSLGGPVTVTYSFLTSVPGYYSSGAGERNRFVAMNAAQKQAARDSFANYAEVANITFVEVGAGTGSPSILERLTSETASAVGPTIPIQVTREVTTAPRSATFGSPIATRATTIRPRAAGNTRPISTRSVMRSG